MSQSPLVVHIPGRRNETVAIVNTHPEPCGMQKRTPEWMVSFFTMDKPIFGGAPLIEIIKSFLSMFSSSCNVYSFVSGFATFTELFGWNAEVERFVGGEVAGDLMSSAGIKHSPLTLVIPAGSFAADIESCMYRGAMIDYIFIVRLGYVFSTLSILQMTTFEGCRIVRFQQQLDRLIIHCTILKKEVVMTVFGQNGFISGVAVGKINIKKNHHNSLPVLKPKAVALGAAAVKKAGLKLAKGAMSLLK